MGSPFETSHEIVVSATPEQVWDAIATGPGVDSWFMGRNEIEPRVGGTARMTVGTLFTGESTVTAWDPPHHFAYQSDKDDDGSFMAFEFFVEGRGRGSTAVRLVHSGFLGGDDWESEYAALRAGDPLYLRSLGVYLTHFPGRKGTPIGVWAKPQPSEDAVWAGLKRGLTLTGTVREGDVVRLHLDAHLVDGVVDTVLEPSFLGVRTDDALYRFVGRGGSVGTSHHLFTPGVDRVLAEETWQRWLNELFG
jgi:uncharacterized protein YndB with AHSA1/START domain